MGRRAGRRAHERKYQGEHDRDYLLDTSYTEAAEVFEVVPTKALAWQVTALERWQVRRWRAPRTP